jgi:integration host factor subunit beta
MKRNFSRKDIVRRASYKLNMSIDESKVICDCFFEILQEMLVEEEDVHLEIRRFGVFDVKKTKKRTNALNPRTKEKVIIPERKRITFKPSKKIKEILYKKNVN